MPVTVGAAHAVDGGDDIADAIEDVLQDAVDLVGEATRDAALAQRDRMRQAAAEHPRWASMAQDIDVWPEGDTVAFGAPMSQQVYEAEYGDPTHAPAPIIRMGLRSAVVDMGWAIQEAFQRAGHG